MPTDTYRFELSGSGTAPGDKLLTVSRTAGTGCTEVHGTYRNEAWWLYGGTNFMQKIEDASDVNAHLLSPCVCVAAKLETETISCGGEPVVWPAALIRISFPTLKPWLRQWLADNEGEFTCSQIANFAAAIELFEDTWFVPRLFTSSIDPHYFHFDNSSRSIPGGEGDCDPAAPADSFEERILISCGCFGTQRIISAFWVTDGVSIGLPLSDMFVRIIPATTPLIWETPAERTEFPADESNHYLSIAFGGETWSHSIGLIVEPIA